MAMVVEQEPVFKYFCRICKKGFGCGRALGGHMRAHGIGDENGHNDDDDPTSEWEDKHGENSPPGTKRMYALRTNPNRLKSHRGCENCGKEFSSWKSFLEHGKCNLEHVESFVSSPRSKDEDWDGRRDYGWSKGKRTRRTKVGNSNSNCPSSEEEDLANCLVMLSSARVDPLVVETEESCASASKEDERRHPISFMVPSGIPRDKAKGVAKGMFECKACKKVFSSHQALGGHRASHKKVKGCFATKLDDPDESIIIEEDVITHNDFSIPSKSNNLHLEHAIDLQLAIPSKRKSKVHECSICHRIFSSGQALGGHKRCHWLTSNSQDTSSIDKFHQFKDRISHHLLQRPKFNMSDQLDLNLPAPTDDITQIQKDLENPLSLQVSTEICLQPWIGVYMKDNNNNNATTTTTTTSINASMLNMEDEGNSKVKQGKLSDLKDMNLSGDSSPWLQVGIGSTRNMGNDP